jgi:hypothetical protein
MVEREFQNASLVGWPCLAPVTSFLDEYIYTSCVPPVLLLIKSGYLVRFAAFVESAGPMGIVNILNRQLRTFACR